MAAIAFGALADLHEHAEGGVIDRRGVLEQFAGGESGKMLGLPEAGSIDQAGQVDEHHLFVFVGEHQGRPRESPALSE